MMERLHKLSQVTFHIPMKDGREDYLAPVDLFQRRPARFEMDFVPVLDRAACTSAGIIKSDQHQVFGRFYRHGGAGRRHEAGHSRPHGLCGKGGK